MQRSGGCKTKLDCMTGRRNSSRTQPCTAAAQNMLGCSVSMITQASLSSGTPLTSLLLIQLNESQSVQRLHLGCLDETSGARTNRLALQHNLLCSHQTTHKHERVEAVSTLTTRITHRCVDSGRRRRMLVWQVGGGLE